MTGAPPVLDRSALRDALAHMRIESPDGVSLERALAERNGWPPALAERVVDEYCGFLYLAATAGSEVTPSQAVDEAWHLHLTWPHYRGVLCREILGRPLEHRPGTGEPGEDERYRDQYARTLELYEAEFGKPPPADIWPPPGAWEDGAEDEAWELRQRPGRRRLVVAGVAAAFAAALTTWATPLGDLVLACVVAAILLSVVLPRLGPARRRRNGGGGGCCGSDTAGGSDCGASCGGGCGGD